MRDYERQPWPVAEETEMYVTKSFGQREEDPRTESRRRTWQEGTTVCET